MRWNLRLAAANRGIWKASELQRLLAEHGLVISAGKMSGLWSGNPASIKLDDLDVICAVLGCGVEELLIPEPGKVARPAAEHEQHPGDPSAIAGYAKASPWALVAADVTTAARARPQRCAGDLPKLLCVGWAALPRPLPGLLRVRPPP
ncbi:MAG: helix-turn-helix transcriptional regulator [Actinomycetota bacterium]|nr:helix-turn-helix transcriptional regulator [Actinomycetota bacterium]